MAFNGSGVFFRLYSWVTDAANGIPITPARVDGDANDIAAGLTNCVTRNGQSPPTANLPMGNFKLTGLTPGTTSGDSVSFDQLSGSGTTITFQQAGGGTLPRNMQDKERDIVSVFDFMTAAQIADVRAQTFTLDVTAAIQSAINTTAALGIALKFPGGVYSVLPATSQAGAGSYNTALVMASNMHLIGERGAVIRVANNYSTNGSPKELAIFSTVAHLANVTFEGITFDLNGANNLMSPSRPATYNQFNHAAILVNGPTGYMDDVVIDKCIFQNTAGVCYVVAALVAVATTPVLGQRWTFTNNYFHNGGLDTNDHTSIYAWCEDVYCANNTFWEDTPPHTVGKTGGATCYEIHGSNQRFVNNYCYNYTLGLYVAPNFTNKVYNSIVQGNTFYCSDYAVLLWRGVALGYTEVDGVLISGNTAYFDNYTYTGQNTYKAFAAYQGQIATIQGAINNVKISDNIAYNTGNTLLAQFVRWDTSTTAANFGSNLSVTDNQVYGFTDGFYLVTNASNGIGNVEVSRNQFINNTPDSLANPTHGIFCTGAVGGTVKTLTISDNMFIDERGSPLFVTAIVLTGNIPVTNLALGPMTLSGLTGNYITVNGGATITNRIRSDLSFKGLTPGNIADGGVITFTTAVAGINPNYVSISGYAVSGDIVDIASYGSGTITASIKNWTGGVKTAGTAQQIFYRADF